MLLFPFVTVLVLLVLFLRLWYFQVVKSEELKEKGQSYQQSSVSKLAPRGLIYDRRGILLAGSRSELVLTAAPGVVAKQRWALDKVATLAGLDPETLFDKAADSNWKPYIPAPLFVGLPIDVATRIAESGGDLPGIGVETQPMRHYPDPVSFTHVLGYAWVPNEDDVERLSAHGIKAAPYVGKLGIEYVYESLLMGKPGRDRVEIDSKRRPTRVVGTDRPVPGAQINLGIEAGVQQVAARMLAGRKGGAVAIDPQTGEVLCLVSSPSYDLNLFQGGISKREYARISSGDLPQLNRAIYAAYQPGSTFKIVTTIAAMRAGTFSEHQTVYCPGFYALGKRHVKCLGKHGPISFRSAMARSCNTYFSTMAVRAGPDWLRRTALDLGLGAKTGIDLLGEGRGIIPTDEWLLKWRNPPEWRPGDTVNMGIGQGETLATAVQMASLVALVANEGHSFKPHVMKAFRQSALAEPTYVQPEVNHRIEMSPEAWLTLKNALEAVVSEGTARGGQIEGLSWAGKTGSAEHTRGQRTHGWFVGYAPAGDPRIAVAVVVEAAGHGGEVAVPIAREMVRSYLRPAAIASNPLAVASARSASGGRPPAR